MYGHACSELKQTSIQIRTSRHSLTCRRCLEQFSLFRSLPRSKRCCWRRARMDTRRKTTQWKTNRLLLLVQSSAGLLVSWFVKGSYTKTDELKLGIMFCAVVDSMSAQHFRGDDLLATVVGGWPGRNLASHRRHPPVCCCHHHHHALHVRHLHERRSARR